MNPLSLVASLCVLALSTDARAQATREPLEKVIEEPVERSAEPQLTLSTPAISVPAGSRVRLGVYFRNATGEPQKLLLPTALLAKLVSPLSEASVELVRIDESLDSDRTLAPAETLYVEYLLTLPAQMSGRLVLQLSRIVAAPAVLDVHVDEDASSSGARPDEPEPTTPESELPVREVNELALEGESLPLAPAGFGIADYAAGRFQAHEPLYFIAGNDRPTARFQVSFKYQIANPEGPLATKYPFFSGLHLAYTQSSLWDLAGDSKPFTDTNYKPEILWSKDRLEWASLPFVKQIGLQSGIQHESNGRDGDESRSLNLFYVQPVLFFGEPDEFHWRVSPKMYFYFGDMSDNDDLDEYRGYCDLKISAGKVDGLMLAALGRLGSGGDHGSVQVDATYPLRVLGSGSLDLFLQAQYFNGYGESLITYDERTDAVRIGLALSR